MKTVLGILGLNSLKGVGLYAVLLTFVIGGYYTEENLAILCGVIVWLFMIAMNTGMWLKNKDTWND